MTDYSASDIVKAREEAGLEVLSGMPSTFKAIDFQIAGEDQVNNRLLVTIVDWARLVMLGGDIVPHVPRLGANGASLGTAVPPLEITREELFTVRDALDTVLAKMAKSERAMR